MRNDVTIDTSLNQADVEATLAAFQAGSPIVDKSLAVMREIARIVGDNEEAASSFRLVARELANGEQNFSIEVKLKPLNSVRAPGDTPIYSLELPIRARKACIRMGIGTVEELSRKSMAELMETRNCSERTVNAVQQALVAIGWSLRTSTV